MSLTIQTQSTEGFTSTSEIRDFTLEIDASGESTPNTQETLLATYAACFVPALRVGAEQRNLGDLGQIDIEVRGELDDDDKLESCEFDIHVEADLNRNDIGRLIERAESLCKVHAALRPGLLPTIAVNGIEPE